MKAIITAAAVACLFTMASCNHEEIRQRDTALLMQQHTIDSMNNELTKKKVIDSMNEITKVQYMLPQTAANTMPVVQAAQSTAPRVVYVNRTSSRRYSSYRRPVAQSQAPVYSQASNTYQQAPAKKGWSAKAKGAVIGGAGGAIAGAIINGRNRPVGALIGGVLGAGAGTGIGAIIDRKNGR